MFDKTSRYANAGYSIYRMSDGTPIRYVQRRFVARVDEPKRASYADSKVRARVDLLAQRLVGDPLSFWRVCDAAAALDPLELVRARAPK